MLNNVLQVYIIPKQMDLSKDKSLLLKYRIRMQHNSLAS